jgi:hypothetical protein
LQLFNPELGFPQHNSDIMNLNNPPPFLITPDLLESEISKLPPTQMLSEKKAGPVRLWTRYESDSGFLDDFQSYPQSPLQE